MAENGNGEKAKYINLMVEFTAKARDPVTFLYLAKKASND